MFNKVSFYTKGDKWPSALFSNVLTRILIFSTAVGDVWEMLFTRSYGTKVGEVEAVSGLLKTVGIAAVDLRGADGVHHKPANDRDHAHAHHNHPSKVQYIGHEHEL